MVSLALGGALLAPTHALAKQVSFTLASCDKVRVDEVSRLLEIERGTLIAKLPARSMPRIAITCGPEETTIGVQDPLTKKTMMRSIPSPPRWGPGSERVLAIATSELLVASWLELLVQETKAQGQGPAIADAREAIRGALHARVEEQRRGEWSASVALGGRARQLSNPFWLWQGRVRVARDVAAQWALFVEARAESGRTSRRSGEVDALLFGGSVGAVYAAPLAKYLAIEVEAGLGAIYGRLRGLPDAPTNIGSDGSGAAGEAMASIGLRWTSRRLRVGLALETGVTLPSLRGEVQDDEAVLLSGAWLGGVARFSFTF